MSTMMRLTLLAGLLVFASNLAVIAFVYLRAHGDASARSALEQALLVAGVLSALLGVAAGAIIARFVERRLRVIAGAVDLVAKGNLTRRAPLVSAGDDAFDGLSQRVNTMLDRIERLMRELQLLTDSLAHDLRSPLSRLRVKVERAISLEEGEGRDAALNGLLQETDIIMRMLSLQLEIGRLEAMEGVSFMEPVDPAELITDLAEMYEPVMEEAQIAFDYRIEGAPPPLRGHRELLAQALSNLIDNAMRHGASGGVITARLFTRRGRLVFAIEDRGPGIPPEQRAEARRRFGRLDEARSRPGSGLGLALAEAVAKFHDGALELADNAPGLSVRIVLPAADGARSA